MQDILNFQKSLIHLYGLTGCIGVRVTYSYPSSVQAEKNELRDEDQRLKADKDKLKQQTRAMSAQLGFLPHPSAIMGFIRC